MSQQEVDIPRSKYRRLSTPWRVTSILFAATAILLVLFFNFSLRPFGFTLIDASFLYILLSLLIPLCFIWIPPSRRRSSDKVPIYDVLLSVLAFSIPLYFVYNVKQVLGTWDAGAPPLAVALATLLWLVSLEASRRAGGPVFATLILVFSFYPLFSSQLPGILYAPSVSFLRLASFHIMSPDGLLGTQMRTFGEIVVGYMVYSIVVGYVGAGQFFNDLTQKLIGRTRGGTAKVSIVSSSLFGSISGISMANVYMTGSFTIPAMKKMGFKPEVAGAVEAVASTGGALMPPVMGSTAFIMAQFMGVSYAEIAIAAMIPALLYYLSLFVHVDCHAAHQGIGAEVVRTNVPPIWKTLVRNSHLIISVAVLIYFIFYLRLASEAPWIASAVAIGLGMIRKETRLRLGQFIAMLEESGRSLGELASILGTIGLIVGAFIVTGLAYSFAGILVHLAGGNLYLLLLLGATAAFILGMGVSMVAVYIFMAIVLAPALTAVGVTLMGAHLFVFFWALVACFTPPVAITAVTAATLAGADPMRTGWHSARLALSIYLIPFVFALRPELLLQGSPLGWLEVIPTTALGIIALAMATEGYAWWVGVLTRPSRILLFANGLLFLWPDLRVNLLGAGLLILSVALSHLLWRQRKSLAKALPKEGIV